LIKKAFTEGCYRIVIRMGIGRNKTESDGVIGCLFY
jgi:hypothetical protein